MVNHETIDKFMNLRDNNQKDELLGKKFIITTDVVAKLLNLIADVLMEVRDSKL